jgi:hypothetical protein
LLNPTIHTIYENEESPMKKMNKYFRNVLYGLIAWLVPFLVSIPFYTREGKLVIDIFLFKSIMIVVGSITAAILLVSYFKHVQVDYVKQGIIVGVIWFALNILLDLIILLPMSGMSAADYFTQIGLRYLAIPTMSIAIGMVLRNK